MENTVKSTTQKSKTPVRVLFAILFGTLGWAFANGGLNLTLLPAQIGAIDPVHKVAWLATLSTISMIVSAIANVVAGAISDRTRSRFGRRTPWMIGGALGMAVLFFAISLAHSVMMLIVLWSIYQIALNSVVAAVAAIMADYVDPARRGTASTMTGIANTASNYGSGIVAAQFLVQIKYGIWLFAVIAIVLEFVAVILLKEKSSKNMELPKLQKGFGILKMFSLPTKGGHDFYFALFGRYCMISGTHMILGYQLYIFTDYMKLGTASTQANLSKVSLIMMLAGLATCVFAGPLADKFGRYKLPVVCTTVIVACAAFIPFIQAKPWTMIAFACIAGLSMGAYNAIDQALLVQILPSGDEAAKDLGVLNLANTMGNVTAPVLAGFVISMVGYRFMFPAEAIVCLLSGFLISRIKGVK